MATSYKVLGQANPVATTVTTLYTVPAATMSVCSTLAVASLGSSATFRVAVRPAGATLENKHYIAYDVPVGNADSVFLTLGLSLSSTDVVSVYASTANVSFSLFGSEVA